MEAFKTYLMYLAPVARPIYESISRCSAARSLPLRSISTQANNHHLNTLTQILSNIPHDMITNQDLSIFEITFLSLLDQFLKRGFRFNSTTLKAMLFLINEYNLAGINQGFCDWLAKELKEQLGAELNLRRHLILEFQICDPRDMATEEPAEDNLTYILTGDLNSYFESSPWGEWACDLATIIKTQLEQAKFQENVVAAIGPLYHSSVKTAQIREREMLLLCIYDVPAPWLDARDAPLPPGVEWMRISIIRPADQSPTISGYTVKHTGAGHNTIAILSKNIMTHINKAQQTIVLPDGSGWFPKCPILFNEAKMQKDPEGWIVLPKLDGMRLVLVLNVAQKRIVPYTRHCYPLPNLTLFDGFGDKIPVLDPADLFYIIEGELIWMGAKQNSGAETAGMVNRLYPPGVESFMLHVFDYIPGSRMDAPYEERLALATRWAEQAAPLFEPNNLTIWIMPSKKTQLCDAMNMMAQYQRTYEAQPAFEGIIVRNQQEISRKGGMFYKYKAYRTLHIKPTLLTAAANKKAVVVHFVHDNPDITHHAMASIPQAEAIKIIKELEAQPNIVPARLATMVLEYNTITADGHFRHPRAKLLEESAA